MTTMRSDSGLDVVLDAGRTFFHQKREQMRRVQVRRNVYRATLHELSSLTDRDLDDLGIARSSIEHMALEAANDF